MWVLTGTNAGDRLREGARGKPNLHFVEVAPSTIGDRVLRGAPPATSGTLRGSVGASAWRDGSPGRSDSILVHHVTFGSLVWGTPLRRLPPPLVFGPVGGGQVTPRSLAPYLTRSRGSRRSVASCCGRRCGSIPSPCGRFATRRQSSSPTATRNDWRSRAGRRAFSSPAIRSVPPGMNGAAAPNERHEEGPIRLLWVGRLRHMKGLPLALDALSRVQTPTPWECVVVGGGPLGDHVPAWIEGAGLHDRVQWVGSVPWHEVARHYREADVFLFTSLRDAFGAQLFEAAAFGLPMIGLAHHGMEDLIPDDVAIKVPILDGPGTADALPGPSRA